MSTARLLAPSRRSSPCVPRLDVYAALVFLRLPLRRPVPLRSFERGPARPAPRPRRDPRGSARVAPPPRLSFGPGGGIESTVTSSERRQRPGEPVPHVAAEPWPSLHPAHRTPLATPPSIEPLPPRPRRRRRPPSFDPSPRLHHDGSQSRIRCVDIEPYRAQKRARRGAFPQPCAAQSAAVLGALSRLRLASCARLADARPVRVRRVVTHRVRHPRGTSRLRRVTTALLRQS